MAESGHDEFAMDLVGDDEDIVAQADLADAPQFLRCPDASRRVVGIAENHQLHRRIGGRVFQSVEINRVGVVAAGQFAFGGRAAAVGDGDEEVVVDGSLHQHLVARAGQRPEDGREGGNHTGHGAYPFARGSPSVPPCEPARNCRIVALRDLRIAEDAVFDPAAKRLDDGRGRPEIHVCHPHRQDVVGGFLVPLQRVRAPPRDRFVEIVVHHTIIIRRIAAEGFSGCFYFRFSFRAMAGCR